jgi:alkylation response protein AidB-like acyl-CoA dehydrogenase
MYLPRAEEQRLVGDAALRAIEHDAAPDWNTACRLGWAAAALPETHGGLGGCAADILPFCEAIGMAGAALPYLAHAVLPGALLGALDPERLPAGLIGNLLDGRTVLACALQGDAARVGPGPAAAGAADGATLTGTWRHVAGAHDATDLLLCAGGALWLVDATAACVARGPHGAMRLAATPARRLGPATAARERAEALGLVAVLAESVGLMRTAFAHTKAWCATRRQFGRTLAANQVVRHRLADMLIALEESESMLNLAVFACDRESGLGRAVALSSAKAHVARAGRSLGQAAVHLHGAMGITEELFAGRAYRRLEELGALFGGADLHIARLARLAAAPEASP